jgi:hypothetical protein
MLYFRRRLVLLPEEAKERLREIVEGFFFQWAERRGRQAHLAPARQKQG